MNLLCKHTVTSNHEASTDTSRVKTGISSLLRLGYVSFAGGKHGNITAAKKDLELNKTSQAIRFPLPPSCLQASRASPLVEVRSRLVSAQCCPAKASLGKQRQTTQDREGSQTHLFPPMLLLGSALPWGKERLIVLSFIANEAEAASKSLFFPSFNSEKLHVLPVKHDNKKKKKGVLDTSYRQDNICLADLQHIRKLQYWND